jgi:hypothetical protein
MSQLAGRMSRMMDRDGDGNIDESEMSRFPSSVRERMGLSNVKSMSVKDFTARTTERFEQRMKERTDQQARDAKSRTSTGSTVFQQSKREKYLPDMPEEFTPGDADQDGQLALFEWAAWKRSEMSAFFEIDSNEDGFLTPRELLAAKDDDGDEDSAFNRDRLAVSGASSGTSRRRGSTATTSRIRTSGSGSSSSNGSTRGSGDRGTSDRGRGDRGSTSTRSWGDRGSTSSRSWGDRSSTRGSDRGDRSSRRGRQANQTGAMLSLA